MSEASRYSRAKLYSSGRRGKPRKLIQPKTPSRNIPDEVKLEIDRRGGVVTEAELKQLISEYNIRIKKLRSRVKAKYGRIALK